MKLNALVSIIVPVYNVERFLEKCIKSIIQQKYRNLEILLIDDGSTDFSSHICDKYANIDKRIRVIHKSNGGLSDARNLGIEMHKGEYIIFVDSDDFIHENMIGDMLKLALNYSADIVECGILYVDSGFDFQSKHVEFKNKIEIADHDIAVRKILDYDYKIMVWNKLFKSELFNSIRFPVGKIHEDEYTTPYLVDLCSQYVKISNQYYAYVQRKDSIMNVKFEKRRLDIIGAQESRIKYFSDKYKGSYDMLMKYHYFVTCINLKHYMRNEFTDTKVNKLIKDLSCFLLKAKELSKTRKIKILIYLILPHFCLQYYRRIVKGNR